MHAMEPRTTHPLIEEAAKKAAVAWLLVPGAEPAYPVWCAWLSGALFVVSGAGEQAAPGLADAPSAQVMLRGDHLGRIVTWAADVSTVEPGGAEWDEVVPQLAGKRLNAPGNAEETGRRWAEQAVVSRLTPASEPLPPPDGALAAPPRPSPATRRPRRPFRLHRVRGSKR
jgi:hypothetical protein